MSDSSELAAWQDLCRRLDDLGRRLGGAGNDPFPGDPTERAEGVAHLAQQVVCWLGWEVGHADPRRPAFHRQNDLWTPWGGPNADNVYRHARVDPARRYRLRGRMHGCEEFLLAVRAGFMHRATWGTLHQVAASELGIGEGDDVDLVLGPDGDVALPDGAVMASIREYYWDWRPVEPATFTIECLDADEPAPRPTGDDVAARLHQAIEQVEDSLVYWNRYLHDAKADREPNSFAPPLQLAKGLSNARYAFCFIDLAPGEALVVDTEVPAARYWSLQLYTMAWFELVDPADRVSSLNHAQAVVADDGRVHAVVSAEDTGAPNWLDTGGRRTGLLTLRWFWPTGAAPSPSAAVVPATEVPGAGTVSPEARAEVLRKRREHLAWRFRT